MTDEGGVLGNLPNSRPGKRSAKRDRPAKTAGKPARTTRPMRPRTTAVKGAGVDYGLRTDPVMRGKHGHDPARKPETAGDPVGAAVRTAAGLAVTGVKVAGAVTQGLLRRLPRP
jgi:hypothetical protein